MDQMHKAGLKKERTNCSNSCQLSGALQGHFKEGVNRRLTTVCPTANNTRREVSASLEEAGWEEDPGWPLPWQRAQGMSLSQKAFQCFTFSSGLDPEPQPGLVEIIKNITIKVSFCGLFLYSLKYLIFVTHCPSLLAPSPARQAHTTMPCVSLSE